MPLQKRITSKLSARIVQSDEQNGDQHHPFISCAKIFEAIGLSEELSNAYFGGLPSRIGGIRLEEIARDAVFSVESGKLKVESSMQQEDVANSQNSSQPNNFQLSTLNFQLNNRGLYSFRKDGEKHAWNPETISTLQLATRLGSYKKFKEFTLW